jgi:quercetin dioxygenase-like cupin family protein
MLEVAPAVAFDQVRLVRGGDAVAIEPLFDALAGASYPAEGVLLLRGGGTAWADRPHRLAMRLAAAVRPRPAQDEIRAFDNRSGTVAPRTLGTAIVAPRQVAATIDDGGTIVFQKLDSLDFQWHRLARAFEAATGQPAQVNVYAGAAAARGLAWHRDPHDVLVLQLAGTKCFQVEARTGVVDIGLRPGDLLWLARGVRHQAANGPAGSIHASLGLLHWMRDAAGVPVSDRRQLAPPIPPCPLRLDEKCAGLLAWRPLRDLPPDLAGGHHLRPDLLALLRPARGGSTLDVGERALALEPADVGLIDQGLCPPREQAWLGTCLAPARSPRELFDALYPGEC